MLIFSFAFLQFQKVLSEIVGFIRNAIREKLKISDDDDVEADDINIEERLDLLSEIESDSGGSDSSVSDGLPMQLLHASVPEVRSYHYTTNQISTRHDSKNRVEIESVSGGSDSSVSAGLPVQLYTPLSMK